MEVFTTTLGYGYAVSPHMFEEWTGLTVDLIRPTFEDVLSDYCTAYDGIMWADFGSNRKGPDHVEYAILARESVVTCDGLLPRAINLPDSRVKKYLPPLLDTKHRLNISSDPQWLLGMYEW